MFQKEPVFGPIRKPRRTDFWFINLNHEVFKMPNARPGGTLTVETIAVVVSLDTSFCVHIEGGLIKQKMEGRYGYI
nr:hypothetical protein CFP56_38022 [Quercus suber]